MKKIHIALTSEDITIPGVIIAFIAGCLTATIFWYFIS